MLLVTFSGLDGCGKSTHVEAAAAYLKGRGYRVRRVVSYAISISGLATLVRDAIRRRRWGGTSRPKEVSATGHAIRRLPGNRTFAQDRNRREVRLKRAIVYPLDSLLLAGWFLLQRIRGCDAVVSDRYVFDRLVNLTRPDGAFARLLLALAPRPDVAVLLDVPPQVCRARREEHPEEYYTSKYESYLRVASRFGMVRVANEDLAAANGKVVGEISLALERARDS